MSLESRPPEILRMIAMDLQIEDLVNFQKSSPIALAATSDVSFYCHFLTKRCLYEAIDMAYFDKDMIPNFKEVLKRPMENKYEFAEFFYGNSYKKLDDDDEWIAESENETELERIGREIGDAFASSAIDLLSFSDITNDVLQEAVSELRQDYPELAKTEHWHFFEDVFYAKLLSLESDWDPEIIELEDFNTLL